MNIKKLKYYINRPEYIFRPFQIYQRIFNQDYSSTSKLKDVVLPWGLNIKVSTFTNDTLGKALLKFGIYDLSLTEVIWRLIEPNETAIDIGANVGYVTSLMSVKVGKAGKVWCFEPNPEVYEELTINIVNWQKQTSENIYPHQVALSNYSGNGVLNLTPTNRGEVFIDRNQKAVNVQSDSKDACIVVIERLDEFLEKEKAKIGVLKIDVEGHELEVLQGAGDLIYKQNIRDIVFEEHGGYPSQLTNFLEENGYTIFRIWKGFWKPRLESPNKILKHPWEPPNYLATLSPDRAIKKNKGWGWQSLTKSTETKLSGFND